VTIGSQVFIPLSLHKEGNPLEYFGGSCNAFVLVLRSTIKCHGSWDLLGPLVGFVCLSNHIKGRRRINILKYLFSKIKKFIH
jgi:hypothetical protein